MSELGLRVRVKASLTDKASLRKRLCTIAGVLCVTALLTVQLTTEQTLTLASTPAATFVDSLGVNVHMEYTDGRYANTSNVLKDLEYLGIRHVRDGVPRPDAWMPPGQGVGAINTLAAANVKFEIVAGGPVLSANVAQLLSLETSHPGMLSAVEGPNEINNWPVHYAGLSGQSAAVKFQEDLYRTVHANPLLRHLPVYYFTGGEPTILKPGNPLADVANSHPYPTKGAQPGEVFERAFSSDYPQLSISKAITETGYYTNPESRNWGGVDNLTQAKGTLACYFEAARQGVGRTFVYQLLDAYLDTKGKNNDNHFGLFDYNNVPKPAATAVHNLTQYLGDGNFPNQSLAFTLNGFPASGRTLVLNQTGDTFVIALWNTTPFWNERVQQPIVSAPVKVEVKLADAIGAERFDPLSNATTSLPGSDTVQVEVPDYPILIKVIKTNK